MNQAINANKAFYILFAVFSLLLFLVFSLLNKAVSLTVGHALYNCKEAIKGLFFSVPHSFPSLFVLMLLLVILIGLILLNFHVIRTKVFIGRILKNKVVTPRKVKDIASQLGIVNRVDVVKRSTFSSFCYRLLTPRICLSLKLVNSLNSGELKAVLVHESYHLKNRDPLKILLSQVVVSMFFFIPILRDFHKYYSLSKELAADQLVIRNRSLRDLKSALTKTLDSLASNLNGIASFVNEVGVEQRIKALTNLHFKADIRISVLKMVISIVVITGAFGILNLPVHAMENGDGTHSYFIMSPRDVHMVSCIKESATTELPFSSQSSFSPINYSVDH